MTVTEEQPVASPPLPEYLYPVNDHGDFEYTLRVFLLLRRHQQGGEWTEVVADVDKQQRDHPDWDMETTNTYCDWQAWYFGENRDH